MCFDCNNVWVISLRNNCYFLVLLFSGEPAQTPVDFNKFIHRSEAAGSNPWVCSLCSDFSHKSKYNVQNHIESKHFPNSFIYNCKFCGREFNFRNTLNSHESKCKNKIWARGLECISLSFCTILTMSGMARLISKAAKTMSQVGSIPQKPNSLD